MLTQLQAPSQQAQKLLEKYNITVERLAGELHRHHRPRRATADKLDGLTQAQRNAALATIFGTDAVRAANVLYKEGASGIRAGSTRSTTPASRPRRPPGR
jgi:TP901 family phage tail tape measure protein